MNVFEAVKGNVTTRQAAEIYGIRVNRHGMAVRPFHNDKNPSMKVDMRFHCFACQADGDAELKKVRDELRDLTVHTANYEELRDLEEREKRKEKEHGRE